MLIKKPTIKAVLLAAVTAALVAPVVVASDVGVPQFPEIPGVIVLPEFPEKLFEIPGCEFGSPLYPACIEQVFPTQSSWDNYIPPTGEAGRVTSVQSGSVLDQGESVVVSAQGVVNTGGWSSIHLSPWVYFMPPADGIQDVTFAGTKPSGMAPMAFAPVNASLSLSKPHWLKGVRIHAGSNSIVVMLDSSRIDTAKTQSDGEYWPFPWGYNVIQ